MPYQFDIEQDTTVEIHMYNAMELAEANVPQEELIKVMYLPHPLHDLSELKLIEERVKELGYDTFEIHKIQTVIQRYNVE